MIVLGLLLLVVAAAVILAAVLRGGDSVSVDLDWFTVKTDAVYLFAAGAATLLLAVIGLWLVQKGLKRSRQRKVENRQLRRRAEESERLAQQRAGSAPGQKLPPGSRPAGGAGSTSSGRGATEAEPDDHFDSTPKEER